ncbi:hypothetical protein DCAR_0934360 [Daucus carota subsp. sativus]|uniref:Uncharacterized protein n=1 Tax=Daucus carota subsp. sativus TaxID=79200 RepID=A0AAF0XVA4_DAUCS|nr:hypothetical protein DCAR_0934360 [Daucus carota subsp. sativus]
MDTSTIGSVKNRKSGANARHSSFAPMSSYSSSTVQNTNLCHCGLVPVLKTSWIDNNPRNERKGCGYYRWHDPPVEGRSKGIIPGLLRKLSCRSLRDYQVLKTSWIDNNPRNERKGRGYYRWHDPPVEGRSKGIIPGLLRKLSCRSLGDYQGSGLILKTSWIDNNPEMSVRAVGIIVRIDVLKIRF